MRQALSQLLGLESHCAAAVVGCGSKTTVIERLAAQNKHTSVLIATTTKILPPTNQHATVLSTLQQSLLHTPQKGVQYMGDYNLQTGKLEALPLDTLAHLVPGYDFVFMEADGSKGLPCKGWQENEPVVPAFATHVLGVVSLAALGQPATEQCVHRLSEFCALTGLTKGDSITLAALTAMVAAPKGMFKNAVGSTALLINQVETSVDIEQAHILVSLIEACYPGCIEKFIMGSAHWDKWEIVE